MGNQNNTLCDEKEDSKLSKFIKAKLNKRYHYNTHKFNDTFIIKHAQNNKNKDERIELDQRRLVFISLVGLYQTWKKVPSVLLYTSLILVPLKRAWIYEPDKYSEELKATFLTQIAAFSDVAEKIFLDVAETKEFIQLLKWKDSQHLVLWILDESECKYNKMTQRNALIAPFWYALNEKLQSLYDHICGDYYQSIQFDENWWKNGDEFVSKYSTKASVIISELHFMSWKFNALQEIIYQSNPKSLHPVIAYKDKSEKRMIASIKSNAPKIHTKIFNEENVFSPLSPIKEEQNVNNKVCVVDEEDPFGCIEEQQNKS